MRIMDDHATFDEQRISPTGSPSSAFGFTTAHIKPDRYRQRRGILPDALSPLVARRSTLSVQPMIAIAVQSRGTGTEFADQVNGQFGYLRAPLDRH
jgi:hypothetical protein